MVVMQECGRVQLVWLFWSCNILILIFSTIE
jgi:hypothetical protein